MKRLSLFFACFLLAASGFAQKNSGLGFNYQAVVRGLDGFVMSSKAIELRFLDYGIFSVTNLFLPVNFSITLLNDEQ